jgi:hypothetical protein
VGVVNIRIFTNASIPMIKKEKEGKVCAFWSPAEQTCKIQNAGLFIPLEDHVEIYCKSAEHVLCRQFRLIEQTKPVAEKAGVRGKNRRKHSRVKTNHHLTLVRLSDSGNVVCTNPSIASTLDISSGGMRLTTRELLMHDSIIQFHFKGSVPSSVKSGLAKVKWCAPTKKDLRYQAGLAFQNPQIMEAMGEYLGLRA